MTRPRAVLALALVVLAQQTSAANPLHLISETYSDWKARLFGTSHTAPAAVDAPSSGPIEMQTGHPQKLRIGMDAPQRDFVKGKSRYRVIELPVELEHAAVRVQVLAQRNESGHGNAVFKPMFYVLGDGDETHEPVEAKPLHLDIRPFRRSRLLGCVTLDKVKRFAVATTADAVGKSYESDVRGAVKAPTPGGFYYTTDAVKVKLPYAALGTVILEVIPEQASGKGC